MATPEDDAELQNLLAMIREDPAILSKTDENGKPLIDGDKINSLYKKASPYAHTLRKDDGAEKEAVILSYTNEDEENNRNFITTSLVGFLFRMFDEYEVPTDTRRWKPKEWRKKKNLHPDALKPFEEDYLKIRLTKQMEEAEQVARFRGGAREMNRKSAELELSLADYEAAVVAEDAGYGKKHAKETSLLLIESKEIIETVLRGNDVEALLTMHESRRENINKPAKAAPAESAPAESAGRSDNAEPKKPAATGKSFESFTNEEAVEIITKVIEDLKKNSLLVDCKADGLMYALTDNICQLGENSANRLDQTRERAIKHPEVRKIVEQVKTPESRTPVDQLEVPQAKAKDIIKSFLCQWFEFNPDAHVRKAYDEIEIKKNTTAVKPKDGAAKDGAAKDGATKDGAWPRYVDGVDPDRVTLTDLLRRPTAAAPGHEAHLETITASPRNFGAAYRVLRNESLAEAVQFALANRAAFESYMVPIFKPASAAAAPAAEHVPPADTFERFRFYTDVNFDALREITHTLYHTKPGMEATLSVHKHLHGTDDDIRAQYDQFVDYNQDTLLTSIRLVPMGPWILMASFKENRKKVHFYNRQTDIIRRIMDQHASDAKLGKDLMRKRINVQKAKNIREEGADASGLEQYRGTTGGKMGGAEKVISKEQMKRLEKAKGDVKAAQELEIIDQCEATIKRLDRAKSMRKLLPEEAIELRDAQRDLKTAKEMIEVPDDAVQIDVHHFNAKSGEFSTTKIYTEAEQPDHLDVDKRRREQMTAPSEPQTLQPFAEEQLRRELASERDQHRQDIERIMAEKQLKKDEAIAEIDGSD